jgi:hypothetical protein
MKERSVDQVRQVYKLTQDIIENLDGIALHELQSGTEKDMDNILSIIADEADRVLFDNVDPIRIPTFSYLDKLTENVDESLRKLNITYFIHSIIPSFEINWHHIEWGYFVHLYNYLCIIAARDSGKSHFFSYAYPLWKMYRYEKDNGSNYEFALSKFGMIITNERSLSRHLLGKVKEEIEDNDILRDKLYPGKTKGWADESILVKNGAKVIARSYGSRMRGYHPGWIDIDDFLVDNVLYSSDQREKYTNIFYAVVDNMLLRGGQCIVTGTPFCKSDLYDKLKEDERFRVFEYPSIYPNGTVLWENRHPLKEILSKKQAHGNLIFSREQLVKPITEGTSIFPWEVLKRCFIGMEHFTLVNNRQSFQKNFQYIVVDTDFAISAEVEADESVFTVIGFDGYDYYVIHVESGKGLEYDQQMAMLKNINNNFEPDLFVIETNGMQKIFFQMGKDAGLPVMPHHTGVEKMKFDEGIPGLAIPIEQGHLKLPRGDQYSVDMTDKICTGLNEFSFDPSKQKLVSLGGHDSDYVLSLWQGMRGIRYMKTNGFSFSFI